ncbi:MAG: D-alanyl-D-alanine carboxypeptidase/D-alanyl-D-alanine endopeptidase [Chitinophagaceae bacterium]
MKKTYKNISKKRITALFVIHYALLIFFSSCSVQKQISKTANASLINKSELHSAHIGICIYDPSTKKYLYNYQSDKYFIPASNTKIFTCYAAMKYLGDSLIGARIAQDGNKIYLLPTGDPTFLHKDFVHSNVLDYLQKIDSTKTIYLYDNNFQDEVYGEGWSWDDYESTDMPERSALPAYGNLVTFSGTKDHYSFFPAIKAKILEDSLFPSSGHLGKVTRELATNNFQLTFSLQKDSAFAIPFFTANGETNANLLKDLLKAKLVRVNNVAANNLTQKFNVIYSQPTDSLLKIMMHRSDNFFAEQSLLMVSNEKLGVMNDGLIIETLLQTDFADLPQKPSWVDGSGLSRFNLFTPQDIVFALNKFRNEFAWNRITTIFATGGTGTLANYYKNIHGQIFAKTGTLNNNVALSGYLITHKGKTLIFSVLVGNHMTSGATIRKAVEKFLETIIDDY